MIRLWVVTLWPWALLAVAIYCLVQIVRDWRAGAYPMVVAGAICFALLALAPLQTQAVKFDVPTRP